MLGSRLKNKRGQMTVELAVCIPVVLAVFAILVNVMSYLEACARFDRVAADAVRIEAASPGYGSYGTAQRSERVRATIEGSFQGQGNVSIAVRGGAATGGAGAGAGTGAGTGAGIGAADGAGTGAGGAAGAGAGAGGAAEPGGMFSLLARLETYECTMTYEPEAFGSSFFGIHFFSLKHSNSYTIDPFRPGALL